MTYKPRACSWSVKFFIPLLNLILSTSVAKVKIERHIEILWCLTGDNETVSTPILLCIAIVDIDIVVSSSLLRVAGSCCYHRYMEATASEPEDQGIS